MAKPIVVIKYRDDIMPSGHPPTWAEMQDFFQRLFPEYYVFSFVQHDLILNFDFEVFHEKDFTEIQYQELTELIEKAIKQL